MKKKILYIDMDGVIADFDEAVLTLFPELHTYSQEDRYKKVDEICEANTNIFETLKVINGSQEAIEELFYLYELYFLSTPMWNVPESFTGKRIWLEKNFGPKVAKRLILTHRKDLNIGHYLVDDRIKNGVAEFTGTHIHFGTEQFPNWKTTVEYLKRNA